MMCMVTAVFAYALDSFLTDAQRSKQASFACTMGVLDHTRIQLVACKQALHNIEPFQNRMNKSANA